MTRVSTSTRLPVKADQVWEMIGHFNTLHLWHPAVESSELEQGGSLRRLGLVGGGSIVERLEKMDDAGLHYRYSIVEGPLPVKDYTADLRVQPDGDGCIVEWSSEFEPLGASADDARRAVEGIYQAGMDNLRKLFGG